MCGGLGKILPIALGIAGLAVGIPAIGGMIGLSATEGTIAGAALSGAGKIAGGVEQSKEAGKAERNQEDANATAARNANATLALQEQATNKANAQGPSVSGLLTSNQTAALGGSTSLSGAGGVKSSNLQLGKNSLLGQ